MRSRSHLLLHLQLMVFLAIPAFAQRAASDASSAAVRIEVQDQHGTRVNDPATATGSFTATLDLHYAYQPGDRILFTGPQEMAVRMDQTLPECLLYAPNPSSGTLLYEIPFGRAEQETGSAYAPDAFSGDSHRVTVRALTGRERRGYRNLALNPCDQPRSIWRSTLMQPPTVWPATSSTSQPAMRSTGRPATDIMACGPISPGDRSWQRMRGGRWTLAGPLPWTRFA